MALVNKINRIFRLLIFKKKKILRINRIDKTKRENLQYYGHVIGMKTNRIIIMEASSENTYQGKININKAKFQ